MKRCPICYAWVNNRAIRCKHCNSNLKQNSESQFINYINSGFSFIEKECAEFENEPPRGKPRGIEDFSLKSLRIRGNTSPAPPVGSAPRGGVLNPKRATPFNKINSMKGDFFLHHEYSEEDLAHSQHVDKIKSMAGKLGSDIEDWETKGLVSNTIRDYYESKIELLKQRIGYMMERLKFRRKTMWDNIGDLLLGTYYFIFNIAFYHFRNIVIPGMKTDSTVSGVFNSFTQAAHHFEDFISSMNFNGSSRKL